MDKPKSVLARRIVLRVNRKEKTFQAATSLVTMIRNIPDKCVFGRPDYIGKNSGKKTVFLPKDINFPRRKE